MLTEAEYRQQCREKEEKRARAERAARGEPEPERAYSYSPPVPSNLTSRQKLERANQGFLVQEKFVEPNLTDGERGMSELAFSRLPPQRRLEIANRAMLKRRGVS